MRIGCFIAQRSTQDSLAEARFAEDSGLDAVWIGDGIWPGGLEAVALAGALLGATTRITVGVNVFNMVQRHPPDLARSAATLEVLFPGRFVLGMGLGYNSFFPIQEAWGYAIRDDAARLRAFADAVAYVHAYFSDDPLTFAAADFGVRDAPAAPFLGGRRPPILIGGSRPSIIQLAARHADVWEGMAVWELGARSGERHAAYFERKREELAEACRKAGRDPAEVSISLTIYAAVAASRPAAEALANEMTPALPGRPAVIGTPDDLVATIESAARLGVTEVHVYPVTRGTNEERIGAIQMLGTAVLPAIRART